MNEQPQQSEPDSPPQGWNPFFPLAALTAGVFVFTVFAMMASAFGDPDAPSVQFFDTYGGPIVVGEVLAMFFFGVVAMYIDRRRSLRRRAGQNDEAAEPPQQDAS